MKEGIQWQWGVTIALLSLWAGASEVFACAKPQLVMPKMQEIADLAPRIEWLPVADAAYYQVALESRVPEGRVLWSQQFRTQETFLLPAHALTADKATLKIRLTAVCNDQQRAETLARVRLNAALACQIPESLQITHRQGQAFLSWQTLPNAQVYQVRAHSAVSGKPELVFEVRTSPLSLEAIPSGLWMLAVQPQCGAANGQSRYRSVLLP